MADDYAALQARLKGIRQAKGNALEVVKRLQEQSVGELTALLPALFSTGYAGEEQEALRDTAQAVLQRKLADSLEASLGRLNETIQKLDASTARLTKVGWWLTIVVGAVGVVVSILVAFHW